MKVKFIHTLLVAAAFITASGAFVSCKDYESDDVQELKNVNAEQYKAINAALDDLDSRIDGLKQCGCDSKWTTLYDTDLKNIKDSIQILNSIKADSVIIYHKLTTDSAAIYAKIKADSTVLSNRILKLRDAVVDAYAKLVTGVEVQQTYSPAFGTLDLPGIQANMLVANYGNNASEFKFPTDDADYFYDADEASNVDIAGATQETIPSGELYNKNLGKIYFTINPTQIDLDGVEFALVNSLGTKLDGVELGTATPNTEDVLKFGYTRAAAGTTTVLNPTIKDGGLDAIKLDLNINKSELKDAVTQLNDHTQDKANIKNLASKIAKAVYDNLNGKAVKYGISTEYYMSIPEDNALESTTDQQKYNNVSDLNVLVAAYKPAGFGALDALDDVQTVPGLERIESALYNFIQNNGIKLSEVKGVNYNAANNKYILTQEVNNETVTFDITNLVNSLNSSANEINSVIKQIQDLQDLKPGNNKSIYNKVVDYLDRANDTFANYFNRAKNAVLKPVLLVNADDGIHRLSTFGASVAAGTYTLIPTTWNYELLAPAYKKYLKVAATDGSDTAYNQVLSDEDKTVDVPLKSGKTYNVTYEAVDYNGKVSARTYTINVK